MRGGDIFYEIKYLIHCIMYRDIGIAFCWVPSHCGHYWNEISEKLAKQGAMKKCLKYHPITYYSRHMRLLKYLRRLRIKQIEKSKFVIPSCSRYLARAICKLRLNSWNTKDSQSVTCVCKNILSVEYILLECPITTELFKNKWI